MNRGRGPQTPGVLRRGNRRRLQTAKAIDAARTVRADPAPDSGALEATPDSSPEETPAPMVPRAATKSGSTRHVHPRNIPEGQHLAETGSPEGSTAKRSAATRSLIETSPPRAFAFAKHFNLKGKRVRRQHFMKDSVPVSQETRLAAANGPRSASQGADVTPPSGGPSARSAQAPGEHGLLQAEEINSMKLSLSMMRQSHSIAHELVAEWKGKVEEAEKRIRQLELAQEASLKLISEMRERERKCSVGPKKAIRKRKDHKQSLRAMRQEEVAKMVRRDCLSNAEFIAGQVCMAFDDKMIRMISCRVVRGLEFPSDVSEQYPTCTAWVPDAEEVTGGRGTINQRVPENPLFAARRPLYGGGLITIPGMLSKQGSPIHFEGAVHQLAMGWLSVDSGANLRMLETNSKRTFTQNDVVDAAEKVSHSALRGAVREAIHRAVGELKKSLTDKFFRHAFPTVNGKTVLSSLSPPEKLAVFRSLGAGSVTKIGLNMTRQEWCRGVEESPKRTENPFSHWRGLTVEELQENIDHHLEGMGAESDNATLDIAYDNWESQTNARDGTSPNCPVDKLFLNSHAVAAMQAFVGLPTLRSGNIADGTLSGPSSVLSIARADAWMATVVAIGRQEAEEVERSGGAGGGPTKSGKQGRRNQQFKVVFEDIFPLAVEALIAEIRGALEQWATDVEATTCRKVSEHGQNLGLNDRSVELHAPFSHEFGREVRIYNQKCNKILETDLSLDGLIDTGNLPVNGNGYGVNSSMAKDEDRVFPRSEPDSSCIDYSLSTQQEVAVNELQREWSDGMRSAVEKSVICEEYHDGDPFMLECREATTAFAIKDKKSSTSDSEQFIALKPEFFKSSVCYWFGEVQDAYVGRWKACGEGSHNQSGASNNGTFYHPLRLDGISTHLDSKEVANVEDGDVSDGEGLEAGINSEFEDDVA